MSKLSNFCTNSMRLPVPWPSPVAQRKKQTSGQIESAEGDNNARPVT